MSFKLTEQVSRICSNLISFFDAHLLQKCCQRKKIVAMSVFLKNDVPLKED